MDPIGIHGTGRCTCCGEGRCAWCQEICPSCGGCSDEFGCLACNNTGYADGLWLSEEERAAKIAAIRADEADYAALGYPETELWHGTELAFNVFAAGGGWELLGQELLGQLGAIQKDIRSDTDNG